MFRISTETELLESFRFFERSEVELPQDLRFPLAIKDYLAWVDSSASKTFLIFRDAEQPLGIVFHRGPGGVVGMCEWCHCVGEGTSIGFLGAAASATRRVAVHVCSDLSCKEKIQGTPGANDFPKLASSRERIRAVLGKMSRFARQNLF